MARDLNLLDVGGTVGIGPGGGYPAHLSILLLLTVASLAAAVCVAVSGIIGFVGLLVPHMMRTGGGTGPPGVSSRSVCWPAAVPSYWPPTPLPGRFCQRRGSHRRAHGPHRRTVFLLCIQKTGPIHGRGAHEPRPLCARCVLLLLSPGAGVIRNFSAEFARRPVLRNHRPQWMRKNHPLLDLITRHKKPDSGGCFLGGNAHWRICRKKSMAKKMALVPQNFYIDFPFNSRRNRIHGAISPFGPVRGPI